MARRQHKELHNTEHNHGPIWKTVADSTALFSLSITNEDVVGGKLIRQTDTNEVYRPTSTVPTFRKISDGNKFSNTENLVEARTGKTSLNRGSSTNSIDTETLENIAVPETTNTTIYTRPLVSGASVYVSIIALVLTTTQGNRVIEKYEGWFNNIAGTITKDAEQANSNLGGTGHLSGSFTATDISVVYNGPAGTLIPFIQIAAAPPGSWA